MMKNIEAYNQGRMDYLKFDRITNPYYPHSPAEALAWTQGVEREREDQDEMRRQQRKT